MIHDLADFFRVGLRKRAAEDSKILAEHKHHPAVDRAIASHHAVAGNPLLVHAEIVATMLDEHVPFFKRARIQQQFNPLPRRQLAFRMMRIDPLLPAPEFRRGAFSSNWRTISCMANPDDL